MSNRAHRSEIEPVPLGVNFFEPENSLGCVIDVIVSAFLSRAVFVDRDVQLVVLRHSNRICLGKASQALRKRYHFPAHFWLINWVIRDNSFRRVDVERRTLWIGM